MQVGSDLTWRLIATAEWTFAALDPSARSVDLVVPAPIGPATLRLPLEQVQAAHLPQLGGVGAEVDQNGITLQVTGVASTPDGFVVQVAARSQRPAEHVSGLGSYESGHFGQVWGRMLWDSQGHQYPDMRRGQSDVSTDGDAFLQTLTFATLPPGADAATLEVPSVFVREDTGAASLTVPVAGRRVGDVIALDTDAVLGRYALRATSATIETSEGGAQLVVSFDPGGEHDGRSLVLPARVQVAGRDDLQPRAGAATPTGQFSEVRVPLPSDTGEELTLTFSGALVEVRGPWRLPILADLP
jgi:hypothetical protein